MKLYLHFYGTAHVSLAAIGEITDKVRTALIDIEKRELRRVRQAIPEIPSAAITSAIKAVDSHASDSNLFQLQSVRQGSVGIYIAVTALAYWILDKTLADTVSEAWRETKMHQRLRSFFLKGQIDKLRLIEKELNKGNQRFTWRQVRTNVSIEVPLKATLDEEAAQLSVRIDYTEVSESLELPPTYEQIEHHDR